MVSRIAEIREIEQDIAKLEADKARIKAELLEHIEKTGDYDDGHFKVTRVQSYKRTWNGDKLLKILGVAGFNKVSRRVPDPDLIDELVKEGKIDLKKIKPAFEETPNKAYVKVSEVIERDNSEADKIREALG